MADDKNNMKKYLIVTTQRTGSTWLIDMLNGHKNIASYAELFRLTPEEEFPTFGRKNIRLFEHWKRHASCNVLTRWLNKEKLYRQYFSEVEQANADDSLAQTFGCKVMYSQFQANNGLLEFALANVDEIVHLKRRDHLNVAVSKAYMEQSKIVHSEQDVKLPPITLDVNEMVQYLKKLKRDEQYFEEQLAKQNSAKVLTCYYEDIVADTDGQMQLIHQHIGVEHISPESSFKKVNKAELKDLVVNYDELIQALEKHKLV